jgi:hypothetical protein
MPNQSLARRAGQHPLDDFVGFLLLLVAADQLEAAVLFVGGKEGEVGQDVEDDVGTEQGLTTFLEALELPGRFCGPASRSRTIASTVLTSVKVMASSFLDLPDLPRSRELPGR